MQLLAEQRTEDWREGRKGRITASIAADCLGLGNRSRQWAWRTILGMEEERDNPMMRWGRDNEQHALNCYEAESGKLAAPGGFWVHDRYDWLAASPDGLVGTDGLIEVKCPNSLPEHVPVAHRIQMLVQLAVTGRHWCDYVAWTQGGLFLRRVTPPANLGALVAALDRFRVQFILAGVEPPRKVPRRRAKK